LKLIGRSDWEFVFLRRPNGGLGQDLVSKKYKGRRDCAFFWPVTRNNAQTLVNGSFVLGIVVRIYKN